MRHSRSAEAWRIEIQRAGRANRVGFPAGHLVFIRPIRLSGSPRRRFHGGAITQETRCLVILLMSVRTMITQFMVNNKKIFYLGAIYEDTRKWYAGRRKMGIIF